MNIGISLWYPDNPVNRYDADAQALFARMTTPPSDDRKKLYNTLIVSLKDAGIWSKLDALWVMAAHDSQAANLNWVNSSYTLAPVNSPTFTVDRGYTGDGATSYLSTGYAPNVALGNFLRDNHSLGVWVQNDAAMVDEVVAGNTHHSLNPKGATAANSISMRSSNTNVNNTGATVATSAGLLASNRTANTGFDFYKNGALFESASRPSVTPDNSAIYIGARNNNGTPVAHSSKIISAVYGSGSLSPSEHADLYAALNTYLQGVGAA